MSIKFKGIKDAITLANNSGAPLTSSDIGKPVTLKDAASLEAKLCAADEVIDGILVNVDYEGSLVTVETTGIFETSAAAAITVPGYLVADGAGGVKTLATGASNARAIKYASGQCVFRLN